MQVRLRHRKIQNCSLCTPPFNTRLVRTTTNNIDASWRLISSAFQLENLPNPLGGQYKTYQRRETYRYDPLGRRVWKEMIRDTAQLVCQRHDASSGCRNEVTRTVWDGANILYDVRMLADTTGDGSEGYPAASTFTGSVGYTHAGGIDVPLDLFKGSTVVVPYADWRGTYDVGTCPTTRCTDNQAYFPLKNSTSFGDGPVLPNGPPNWFGEVIGGQTDASGYKYMRNRCYDSRSGRFTQEDPIGLAVRCPDFRGHHPTMFFTETEVYRGGMTAVEQRVQFKVEAVRSHCQRSDAIRANAPGSTGKPGGQ